MPSQDPTIKTKRIKRIRSLAADRLLEDLGRTIDPKDVTFIQAKSKGYNWYLSFADSDDGEDEAADAEYAIPEWVTETQIWRWTVDQCNQVTLWLRHGVLRAESIVEKRSKEKTEGKDAKDGCLNNRAVLQKEVRIVVLTPEEKEAERKKWKKPRATIKGPASDFVSWSLGIASGAVTKRMEQKYQGEVAGAADADSDESGDSSPETLEDSGGGDDVDDGDVLTIFDRTCRTKYGVTMGYSSYNVSARKVDLEI
ncbi:hypothetical protein TWF696_008632 [Orbilia brochopaga]|uniref:Uncharacterized protein n=1 Tax=Orbilia brochopaga TaxID=3140254 RepID=A0AAV9UHP3_9PEZI